jgi:Xaa-Pro aminopeptidase
MSPSVATPETEARIGRIQEALREYNVPAWLFYGFQTVDPLAKRILGLSPDRHETRRWFYLVPASGEPVRIVHKIEKEVLDELPGRQVGYAGWKELHEVLRDVLKGQPRVAMQYSPNNAIPYVSRVDAGTVELVKSCGSDVISSADLVQVFEATWSDEQLASHRVAAKHLRDLVHEAFKLIGQRAAADRPATEVEIQDWFSQQFAARHMVTNHPVIVAANEHSGNPHFSPSKELDRPIAKGDFILLDVWAKLDGPLDTYADITWTGFVGAEVPARHREIFDIVRAGRDAAIDFVRQSVTAQRDFSGYQVDDICRNTIRERGYGDYFIHRTGHSIGQEVHWNGANIDNFETQDLRRILPRTCFSIEPGVYLPEFGVRSEVDVYVGKDFAEVTGGEPQSEVIAILR